MTDHSSTGDPQRPDLSDPLSNPSTGGGAAPDEPAGSGRLIVHVQGSWFSGPARPKLSVDGDEVPTKRGRNVVRVAAGKHIVRVHSDWFGPYGKAALNVDVAPNETVEVFYGAPIYSLSNVGGKIGLVKQKRPGRERQIVTLAAVVLGWAFILVMAWSRLG